MAMQVRISVDRAAAIRHGTTEHGEQVVTLTDADLSSLPEEERGALAAATAFYEPAGGGRIYSLEIDPARVSFSVSAPGVEGVREALRRHIAARAEVERRAADAARERAEQDRVAAAWALRAPLEELIRSSHALTSPHERIGSMAEAPYHPIPWDAPGLARRRDEVATEVARLNDEARRSREAREARTAAEKAAAERRREESAAEIRNFALDGLAGPAAQRAAREEYDVRGAVIDAVQEQLPQADAVSVPKDAYEWEERSSPKADAFALLDRIAAAVQAVTRKPASVELSVSRVMRITEPDTDEREGRKRTGVVVTIHSPATESRHLLYYVEK